MIDVVITGHRPQKLPRINEMFDVYVETLSRFNVRRLIQGMAAGADLIAAKAAYELGIPFVAVRPGEWHKAAFGWEGRYSSALKHAESIHVLDTCYHPVAFQQRNEFMVDLLEAKHQDIVISAWDGSPSGTRNCIKYADKKNIRIWNIDPSTLQGAWLK